MRKVLMVQRTLQPTGGGDAVAAWMLQALREEYAITVLAWQRPDLEGLNDFYGTSLRPSDFQAFAAPQLLRRLYALDPDPNSFQGFALLMRLCKVVHDRFDVLITADNETDLGRRGIQYIHYPYLHTSYRQMYPERAGRGSAVLWRAIMNRCRPWRLMSGFSFDRMKTNLTLVNSNWTGARVRELWGIDSRTVYPPAAGVFPACRWSERENGFVCLGRIAEEKKFGEIIDILAAVRSSGHDVHLHIIGVPGSRAAELRYLDRVRRRVHENANWIRLHERLPRDELVRLVAKHRYGIHALVEEHFGIAVAEMVRAGCIVFVPGCGGQLEIVGPEERLLFGSKDEAVAKILRVLENPGEQHTLRGHLAARSALFSEERFMGEIQEIVRAFARSAI